MFGLFFFVIETPDVEGMTLRHGIATGIIVNKRTATIVTILFKC